ncbi:MAG: hypothetical protein JXR91_06810 [Deltaproteobacteria bacterium]|nr:hypothetical protein [Deltaproteobacteria bacterium]
MPKKIINLKKHPRMVTASILTIIFILIALIFSGKIKNYVIKSIYLFKEKQTITSRLKQFSPSVHSNILKKFKEAGVNYPPKNIILIGLKKEKRLEVWVSDNSSNYIFLKNYPILAASGTLGPKLKEGDNQVPEGIYQVESLNPNSLFHLALRLNYPNSFDKQQAKKDNRTQLGSDIMIHGSNVSVGCLAIGDIAAEELFVLSAETGIENIKIILTPIDFRKKELNTQNIRLPDWSSNLYKKIKHELEKLSSNSFHPDFIQ